MAAASARNLSGSYPALGKRAPHPGQSITAGSGETIVWQRKQRIIVVTSIVKIPRSERDCAGGRVAL
jgi:hypothetical protein